VGTDDSAPEDYVGVAVHTSKCIKSANRDSLRELGVRFLISDMHAIPRPATLTRLLVLVIAGLLLAACDDEAIVTPASSTTATAAGVPAPAAVELSGTPPASVTAGKTYLFQPTVTQGGGTVTFSVAGQPAWATFDTDTGVLTGTPAAANEGTTGSITITGTNGSSSASIGPFTIAVNAPAPAAPTTGSASLSWVAPTENTDGSPITGLAGYHIYYGTSEGAMTTTVTVASPTETTYVVNGLAPGTYYFEIVAYNSSGVDSSDSNTASKTI
jgi:hypothetical protein